MPQDTIRIDSLPADIAALQRSAYTIRMESEADFKKKSDEYASWAPLYTVGMLVIIWLLVRLIHGKSENYVTLGSISNGTGEESEPTQPSYHSYEGKELGFKREEIIAILNKRFPYYQALNAFDKDKFIHRLTRFTAAKTFRIHTDEGFKEMPILISASAIQLSLGLENYMLPGFHCINIFPQEFIGVHPTIRFLEGNVSDSCINISWKHFLNGYASPADGQNVGLHEMAHAYYYQNFETRSNNDPCFIDAFPSFHDHGNKAFEMEQQPGNDLYSSYALTNFHEFWAESVEIFFERPVELKNKYPQLYTTISGLLNQELMPGAEKIS